jgi:hypothetical protein
LYPNPAKDRVMLLMEPGTKVESIKIISMDGRIIRTFRPPDIIEGTPLSVNVAGIPKGIYMVQMQTGTSGLSERIIIQ